MESRTLPMTKPSVLAAIIARLELELEALLRGAKASFAAATDPDSKAENKYDTRTLEASYVARGQAQRVAELQEARHSFAALQAAASHTTGSVRLGSLVVLDAGGQADHYFIGPAEGGMEVIVEGTEVLVITPASPLGSKLMNGTSGTTITLPSGARAVIRVLA